MCDFQVEVCPFNTPIDRVFVWLYVIQICFYLCFLLWRGLSKEKKFGGSERFSIGMTLHCVIRLLFHWHLQQESVEHMRIAIVLDTLAISLASLLTAYVVRFLLQMAGMTHIYNSPVFEKAIKVIRLTLFVTYLTLIGLWLWSLSQVWRRAAYLLIACNCLFFTFPVIRFVGSRLVVFIQQSVESKTQFSGPTTGHRKTRAIAFAIRAIGYYVFLVLGLCFLLILVSEWIQDPSALIAIKILCHGHFYCASFSFVIFFFYFHSI